MTINTPKKSLMLRLGKCRALARYNELYLLKTDLILNVPEDWEPENFRLFKMSPLTTSNLKSVKLGLYRIYWNDGGSSIASVGCDREGKRWYAPTNWTIVPGYDWSLIKAVQLIIPHGK